jgi:hypothetical protein
MDQVSNIFQCKTLQNLPQFGFFGLKTNHLATLHRIRLRNRRPGVQGDQMSRYKIAQYVAQTFLKSYLYIIYI